MGRDGLVFVRNALVGAGLRGDIRLGVSGKIANAFDMACAMALGADWCNAARGFMFALGCIQSLSCHTDRCPTGVATQDKTRSRALVVEDKTELRAMLRKALERAGHKVDEAPDGSAAVAKVRARRYLLVLTDLKMPGWNGFDFLQWLQYRSDLNPIPVVVLTSSGLDDDVRKAFALGAKSYLMKPSDFADLQELMRLLKKYWPVIKDTVVVRREDAP